jgi:SAM-dependent methyltransferase
MGAVRLAVRIVQERAARTERPRVPEPMVMDGAESVGAFHDVDPVLQLPIYRLNALALSGLLPEDGVLLDLGSGTGQLLAHLAAARPDVRAIGTDLAGAMLDAGRTELARAGLAERVELRRADMTDLAGAVPSRVDAVSCVWALHHLPGRSEAIRCLRGIAGLRDRTGCAVWIFDFARLRRQATFDAVLDLAAGASPRLREDGRASEGAAWSAAELRGMLAEVGLGDLAGGPERRIGHLQAYFSRGRGERAAASGLWAAPALPEPSRSVFERIRGGMPALP